MVRIIVALPNNQTFLVDNDVTCGIGRYGDECDKQCLSDVIDFRATDSLHTDDLLEAIFTIKTNDTDQFKEGKMSRTAAVLTTLNFYLFVLRFLYDYHF